MSYEVGWTNLSQMLKGFLKFGKMTPYKLKVITHLYVKVEVKVALVVG